MTPRQAMLWFGVFIVVLGIIYSIVSYTLFRSITNTIVGIIIAIIGVVLLILTSTIRWS